MELEEGEGEREDGGRRRMVGGRNCCEQSLRRPVRGTESGAWTMKTMNSDLTTCEWIRCGVDVCYRSTTEFRYYSEDLLN